MRRSTLALCVAPLLITSPADASDDFHAIAVRPASAPESAGLRATVGGDVLAGVGPACLYENGMPNGINGYSNGTPQHFGWRRSIMDDFTVPIGETWTLEGFRLWHVWNTATPPFAAGMVLDLFTDDGSAAYGPGEHLLKIETEGYTEIATGNMYFDREEAESWVSFEPVVLEHGTYWFQAALQGADNNFWLTADQRGVECWVLYDDVSYTGPGSGVFDVPSDVAWKLTGENSGNACAFVEYFDDYEDGSIIVPQGGWEAWGGDAGREQGIVTSTQSRTPIQSLEIDGPDEIVHRHEGIDSGRWRYTVWQNVPVGFFGQSALGLLNEYPLTDSSDWSVRLVTDGVGDRFRDVSTGATLPLIRGWAPIEMLIDLDHDILTVYYDGQVLFTDSWKDHFASGGDLEIAAIDLLGNGSTAVFYDAISLCPDPACVGDVDEDGAVGFADILQILGAWGPSGDCPPYVLADIDKDCDVDFADILAVLAQWGPCS